MWKRLLVSGMLGLLCSGLLAATLFTSPRWTPRPCDEGGSNGHSRLTVQALVSTHYRKVTADLDALLHDAASGPVLTAWEAFYQQAQAVEAPSASDLFRLLAVGTMLQSWLRSVSQEEKER
jgi:hypothetical protein